MCEEMKRKLQIQNLNFEGEKREREREDAGVFVSSMFSLSYVSSDSNEKE